LATGTDTTKKEDGEEDVAECSSDEIRSAVLCECIALLRIGKDQGPSALLSELSEREKKAAEAAAVDSGKSSKDGDDGSERPSIAISDAPANITSLHPVHTDSAMNDPTANTATAVSDNVEQSEIEATAASNKSTVTLTGADSSIAAKMSVSEQNNNAMGAKTNRSATAGGKAAATSSVVSFDQIMKIAAAKTTNSTNNRDNDKVKKPEISSAAAAATDPGNADDIGESKSEKTTETTITQAGNREGR
jgi:mRNA-degrading endonuclease toxin of MazEF toxin-antitoxin module